MKEVIAIVLFVFLIVFVVGGIIWMFVAVELEKIDKGKKDKEIKHEHIKKDF